MGNRYWVLAVLLLIILVAAIDIRNLENYASQPVPPYIRRDNTPDDNAISNAGATLGRVLFYDKKLSANNTIACASCHIQQFAFSDTALLSHGLHGSLTGRHSMRLPYSRFAQEERFFWDERANSLETQSTMPIKDEIEMGFSGQNGQPNFDSLGRKLAQVDYYKTLFRFVYGDTIVTETRIKKALAQFVRSIYSFDSKFDIGMASANNLNAPFQNFTMQENQGKMLFLAPPPNGAGCQGCHRAPEFDIDPVTRNNGVPDNPSIPGPADYTVTRAPSLRDLVNPQGTLNGPMMHNGLFTSLNQVIDHYNLIPDDQDNFNLDPRLTGPGSRLNLNQNQKNAIVAFLRTLTSNSIYTHRKWSDPFDANGNLQVITLLADSKKWQEEISVYPNPAQNHVWVNLPDRTHNITLIDAQGKVYQNHKVEGSTKLNVQTLKSGSYSLQIVCLKSGKKQQVRFNKL